MPNRETCKALYLKNLELINDVEPFFGVVKTDRWKGYLKERAQTLGNEARNGRQEMWGIPSWGKPPGDWGPLFSFLKEWRKELHEEICALQ